MLRELAPGHRVSCHWAEQIEAGVLPARSADEVAAEEGVSIAAPGAAGDDLDGVIAGVDEPIERR